MFCDLIFLIQRVGSKDIQTHTQTRRAEKRALLKSKIFNLENDKEPLDFPIPGELNKDRDVQPSLRARSSPSVLLWTGYCTRTSPHLSGSDPVVKQQQIGFSPDMLQI